ncbi:MAG TPA: histidine kinase dimerization/phospho-acceptor domain-containing protein [Myxococcota bacterium]|nr:histidine kinase dimerization/phospho-acceptor domain-containing protein [Myxococcota bacterium]
MRRIRVALLLLSLAILLPVAVLTWRALHGLAYERAARHQVVAERTFEEMERVLSEFLAAEEARPSSDYRSFLSNGEPVPLAGLDAAPFVVGAFEIDAEGEVHTPMPPERQDEIRRVLAAVEASYGAAPAEMKLSLAPAAPPPGTTKPLADAVAGAEAPQEADAGKKEQSAYDVLQSFNRAASERAERRQKVEEPVYQAQTGNARQRVAIEHEAVSEWKETPASAAPSRALAKRATPPRIRIAVDPMQGRLAGPEHLLLVRAVQLDGETLRQGLVLDRAALAGWLEQRALPTGLERSMQVAFRAADEPPSPPAVEGSHYVYSHRFAEPFDPIAAELILPALPGVGSPGTLYALVALLLAVGAGGILALHRMVSVAVGYAERRSNFVAAVTHELKTPLTAIRMYAEMLRDGLVPSEEKRAEYTRTITDESERLSRLIDNVLEFARLERGRRDLELRAGPLAPVLEEAVAKLASHAARQGFTLELAIEPGLPAVRFDRDALLQVLFNLADNAMKYARSAGARRVVVEARRAGEGVQVAVRDFGPGVATAHLAHIFEPFYRGEDELTRNTQGTGIGLALVRELAQRMGAQVVGANLPEGGFRVSLSFASAP